MSRLPRGPRLNSEGGRVWRPRMVTSWPWGVIRVLQGG